MNGRKALDESELENSLSELEYALILALNGFSQWVVRCGEASGLRNLGPLDFLVLHAVNHRARGKRLADICLVLNIHDNHTVAYSLKKLEELELGCHAQVGRDRTYSATEKGDAFCERYREIRKRCLVESIETKGAHTEALIGAASSLRDLTDSYGEAARCALIMSSEPRVGSSEK